MNMFERIDRQLIVDCKSDDADYIQPWYNTIPEGASEPQRNEEEEECYYLAWEIITQFLERDAKLRLSCDDVSEGAYYDWQEDKVTAPCRKQFKTDADFFCTLFHELVHATGAKHRLARKAIGTHDMCDYNEEELIAELGSMYLCAVCCYNSGLVFEQSVNYIRHYKNATNTTDEDLKLIAKQALQAVDLILGE